MVHIVHPRPQAGRQKAFGQIVFHDGHADFDLTGNPHLEAALRQHGYTLEEVSESDDAVRPPKGSKRSNGRKHADDENRSDTPQETGIMYVSGGLDEDFVKVDAAIADFHSIER